MFSLSEGAGWGGRLWFVIPSEPSDSEATRDQCEAIGFCPPKGDASTAPQKNAAPPGMTKPGQPDTSLARKSTACGQGVGISERFAPDYSRFEVR